MMASAVADEQDSIIQRTRCWLERAVIGLNLCPFARAPHLQQRIRFQVSDARDSEALLQELEKELNWLQATPPAQCETTLLIHPWVLPEFLDFNDFLDVADACLERLDLVGEVQIASFHPRYQFAGSDFDDVENCSNRSPYPILHLLREDSITRVVDAMADPDEIHARNGRTLRELGTDGWRQLARDFLLQD
jgi:hypothetical protein